MIGPDRLAAAIDRAPRPPQAITRLQVRRQLEAMDLWTQFSLWLASHPSQSTEWQLANEIHIDDPWTQQVADDLGMGADEIDTFFREAAKR